jgi:carnitine 3-dehydrogenase
MIPSIEKVAVIGTGIIGSGWATQFAMAGYPVNLYDVDDSRLDEVVGVVASNLKYLREKGASITDIDRALQNLTTTSDLARAVVDASFIQEAIDENIDAKRALLAEIERHANNDTIFASSSSGFPISEIASESLHPERCIGAHPYNPPYLIPLVELSASDCTDAEVLKEAVDFYQDMGKETIVLRKEAPGFIANRLQIALYREAVDLVSRGICSVQDVDKACVFGPGLRWAFMGPNLVFHLGSGPAGLGDGLERYTPAFEYWLSDMANWTSFPKDWPAKAQEGIDAEVGDRSATQGRDYDSMVRYRDDMLIRLLKLHKKF